MKSKSKMVLPGEFTEIREVKRPKLSVTFAALAGVGLSLLAMLWAGREYLGSGLFAVLLVVIIYWLVMIIGLPFKYGWRSLPVLLLMFVVQVAGCLTMPIVENCGTESASYSSCGSKLRCIGQALKAYYDKHGGFPPAYIVDANGTKIHSWRVQLLPFIEELTVYRELQFDKAWNDPKNLPWTNRTIECFQCSRYRWHRGATTSFLAVVGSNTAWPGNVGSTLEDFTDGAANTILLIEVADPHIPWAKPFDLDLLTMFSNPGIPKPSSLHRHPEGFYALFADGSVRFLRADLDATRLRALLTINGGETVDLKDCLVAKRKDSS